MVQPTQKLVEIRSASEVTICVSLRLIKTASVNFLTAEAFFRLPLCQSKCKQMQQRITYAAFVPKYWLYSIPNEIDANMKDVMAVAMKARNTWGYIG